MEVIKKLQEHAKDLTILFVDDDHEIVKIMINYLEKFFNKVDHAFNGEDGLSLAYDLVLTDIQMDKMNGIEMITQIKIINKNQNIIVLSGNSEVNDFLDCIKLEIDGYILKSANHTDMNSVLCKVTEKINKFKNNDINLKKLNLLVKKLYFKNQELQHYTEAVNKVAIVSKTDLKGYITFVNDFFCDISGYKREELIGQNHNIIRHPDVPKSIFENLWNTIQNGMIWEGDVKNLAKDGKPYYVYATIIPLFNQNKKDIKEYISIRFLTNNKEVEKREFKKRVISHYQESKKETFNFKKRNIELDKKLSDLQNEVLEISSNNYKIKNQQLLERINFLEKEIFNNDLQREKILKINSANSEKIGNLYKKSLKITEQQKETIIYLENENKLRIQENLNIENQLKNQRKTIIDLKEIIKDMEEVINKEVEVTNKGLIDRLFNK